MNANATVGTIIQTLEKTGFKIVKHDYSAPNYIISKKNHGIIVYLPQLAEDDTFFEPTCKMSYSSHSTATVEDCRIMAELFGAATQLAESINIATKEEFDIDECAQNQHAYQAKQRKEFRKREILQSLKRHQEQKASAKRKIVKVK